MSPGQPREARNSEPKMGGAAGGCHGRTAIIDKPLLATNPTDLDTLFSETRVVGLRNTGAGHL